MHYAKESTKGGKSHKVAIMWDSVNEPATHAASLKLEANRQRAAEYCEGKKGDDDKQRWFGAPSVEVLKERFTKGWAEGAERLQKIATRDINPMSIRRRRVRGDQGDEVDMQAVWRGDLSRAWTRTRRMARAGTNRTINLMVMLGDSAGVGSEKLFWRGASVLKLADALVASGYNVGIIGAVTSSGCANSKNVDMAQFVEIKATDQPLDLSALAALTAMPGWFRTFGFAGIVTACDLVEDTQDWGLGRPMNDRAGEFASMLGIENVFIQTNVNDQKQAEEWIDSILNKIEPAEQMAA